MAEPKDLAAALDKLWTQYWPLTQERLGVIRQAMEMRARDELEDGSRIEAASAAHKLAGSLGTFGIASGTRDARAIEEALLASEGQLTRTASDLRLLFQSLSRAVEAKHRSLAPVAIGDRRGDADPQVE